MMNESFVSSFTQGFLLMYSLVFLTAYLETTCPAQVAKLIEKKGGSKLYMKAIAMNLFNMMILGTLSFVFVVEYLCQKAPLTIFEQMRGIFGVVVIENFLFFLVHKVRGKRTTYTEKANSPN